MSDAIASEVIKGQAYKLVKVDPIKGGRLATKVIQILAAAVSDVNTIKDLVQAYTDRKEEESTQEEGATVQDKIKDLMETPQLISALAGGIGKIDADALYEIGLEFVRGNLFADRKLHDDLAFNTWFADHQDHLLFVLVWAIRVNCQGFFGFGGKA